jgi:hypothetical protein
METKSMETKVKVYDHLWYRSMVLSRSGTPGAYGLQELAQFRGKACIRHYLSVSGISQPWHLLWSATCGIDEQRTTPAQFADAALAWATSTLGEPYHPRMGREGAGYYLRAAVVRHGVSDYFGQFQRALRTLEEFLVYEWAADKLNPDTTPYRQYCRGLKSDEEAITRWIWGLGVACQYS